MTNELKNQIEALLFASGRKMTIDELKIHLTISSAAAVKEAVAELQKEYEERQSPVIVVQEGDSWKLTTREKYLHQVRKINPNTELTKTMMETLAVIAWKQPITQSEVISIRTNKAYDHIAELERMGFLIKEKYGRTFMLKLTQKFFDYFDLHDAQAARERFSHIKESEETQKKLEQARAAADASVQLPELTEQVKSKEETVSEETEPSQQIVEEQHQEEVALGTAEEELENLGDREEMLEEDEIQPQEASFVQGYEKDAEKTQNKDKKKSKKPIE
ncbi:MAG: SMC-Scp complex subunit ScpB [Candidatus Woesearchaeota archaeon]|jgi:segregation and condensation protein B